jgi:cation diffusion facilitator CzcD-associated flavoprotein CzcO
LINKFGIRDFEIYDREEGFGGTWLVNKYPGAACDVPSLLYSYKDGKWQDKRRFVDIELDPQENKSGDEEQAASLFTLI